MNPVNISLDTPPSKRKMEYSKFYFHGYSLKERETRTPAAPPLQPSLARIPVPPGFEAVGNPPRKSSQVATSDGRSDLRH